MATRQGGSPGRSADPLTDWRKIAAFVSLAGAVTLVVLIAAALSSDGPSAPLPTSAASIAPRSADPPSAVPLPPAVERTLADEPRPTPRSALDVLAARVATDRDRLSRFDSSWTAQLAVLCDGDRAQAMVDRFGSLDGLHLLPAFVGEDACFRVCWSRYASRDAAQAAADLPAALRAIQPDPLPRRVAEVVD